MKRRLPSLKPRATCWRRSFRRLRRDLTLVDALLGDRMRLSPAVKLEILLSTPEGDRFDGTQNKLDALRTAPLSSSVST